MNTSETTDEITARFRELVGQAVEACKSKQLLQAKALWQQATALAEGRADLATDVFEESVAFGDLQERYGDFEDSRANFELALQVCRAHELPVALLAVAQSKLAVNAVNRGDDTAAATMFEQAIETFESASDYDVLEYADCLNHHGHLLRSSRQWVAATDNYEKAYKSYPQITSLPQNDLVQRRLALRNSLKSTAEQSDASVQDELRVRVRQILPRKGSPDFP
jgi:tetratricopeptide (TPR) repeat protein